MLDWNSLIDDRTKTPDLLVVPNVEVGTDARERERERDILLQTFILEIFLSNAIKLNW